MRDDKRFYTKELIGKDAKELQKIWKQRELKARNRKRLQLLCLAIGILSFLIIYCKG